MPSQSPDAPRGRRFPLYCRQATAIRSAYKARAELSPNVGVAFPAQPLVGACEHGLQDLFARFVEHANGRQPRCCKASARHAPSLRTTRQQRAAVAARRYSDAKAHVLTV
jgi:hypothetical protein